MVMMIAMGAGIVIQFSHQQRFHCVIGIAADTAKQPDTGLGQRILGAATDTAADQHIHFLLSQEIRQGAVAASASLHDPGCQHGRCLHFIDFKCRGMSKMLIDQAVSIGNRNFHSFSSFPGKQSHVILSEAKDLPPIVSRRFFVALLLRMTKPLFFITV
jgi:hypothetical protein